MNPITSAKELREWLDERRIELHHDIEPKEWPNELAEALFDLEYALDKARRVAERA